MFYLLSSIFYLLFSISYVLSSMFFLLTSVFYFAFYRITLFVRYPIQYFLPHANRVQIFRNSVTSVFCLYFFSFLIHYFWQILTLELCTLDIMSCLNQQFLLPDWLPAYFDRCSYKPIVSASFLLKKTALCSSNLLKNSEETAPAPVLRVRFPVHI